METFSGLDPWWVTGFCDGSASFTYSRSGVQIALYFAIKLDEADRSLLEDLRSYFGIGTIYDRKTSALFRVTRHTELPRIADHFERYPLRSRKRESFQIWREMVEIKREFRGRNRESLQELALALTASQARNQGER